MTYTVKPGDNLSKIAQRYGISWKDLYNANKNVIGSNPNLIYSGQKYNIPGQSAPKATPKPAPVQTAKDQGADLGSSSAVKITPWDEVLPWEQYFDPNLARSAAEQTAARYYAPMAQRGRENIESTFADRGLTRSGMRGRNIGDFYDELAQKQFADIEQDYMGYELDARQERNLLQELYEQSEGKEKPVTTAYEAYERTPPTTSAGKYGTTYLNWLNNILPN
jgi:murein DD-endopeptidase MepM/ murein hydrolase activator NlpD